jgi:steroid 5-alpha reductase family enzyme
MYVVGLITETLADYQKWVFKASNPGQLCNVGVWSVSQHPNLFGNLLIWSGIFIMNAPALVDPMAKSMIGKYKRVGLAFLSPLFLWVLFNGQASGAVLNTVEMFEKKYGETPGYREYVDNVPLIVPNPLKMFR